MFRRIIIVNREPPEHNPSDELKWISDSLGLFDSDRDKERSCYRIFVTLVKEKKPLKSDDIALNSRLSRGTVVFHLNKLMDSGLVVNEDNKYKLKEKNISSIIKKMRKEMDEHFRIMEEIAKDFDARV